MRCQSTPAVIDLAGKGIDGGVPPDAGMEVIHHFYLGQEQATLIRRGEVAGLDVGLLTPWLGAAIESCEPVLVPASRMPGHTARASAQGDFLVVTFCGPSGTSGSNGPLLGSVAVALCQSTSDRAQVSLRGAAGADDFFCPPAPWCVVFGPPGAPTGFKPPAWMVKLGRDIAWIWGTQQELLSTWVRPLEDRPVAPPGAAT